MPEPAQAVPESAQDNGAWCVPPAEDWGSPLSAATLGCAAVEAAAAVGGSAGCASDVSMLSVPEMAAVGRASLPKPRAGPTAPPATAKQLVAREDPAAQVFQFDDSVFDFLGHDSLQLACPGSDSSEAWDLQDGGVTSPSFAGGGLLSPASPLRPCLRPPSARSPQGQTAFTLHRLGGREPTFDVAADFCLSPLACADAREGSDSHATPDSRRQHDRAPQALHDGSLVSPPSTADLGAPSLAGRSGSAPSSAGLRARTRASSAAATLPPLPPAAPVETAGPSNRSSSCTGARRLPPPRASPRQSSSSPCRRYDAVEDTENTSEASFFAWADAQNCRSLQE